MFKKKPNGQLIWLLGFSQTVLDFHLIQQNYFFFFYERTTRQSCHAIAFGSRMFLLRLRHCVSVKVIMWMTMGYCLDINWV
uniref:Uncharacterized protein n=1 Tax=Anguilla anguilla TaxID=7936 RepID=A0A0E9RHU8_ANGAN